MLLTHVKIVKFNNHAKGTNVQAIVLNVIEMFMENLFQKQSFKLKNVFHDFFLIISISFKLICNYFLSRKLHFSYMSQIGSL